MSNIPNVDDMINAEMTSVYGEDETKTRVVANKPKAASPIQLASFLAPKKADPTPKEYYHSQVMTASRQREVVKHDLQRINEIGYQLDQEAKKLLERFEQIKIERRANNARKAAHEGTLKILNRTIFDLQEAGQ